jgi:CBS domain-containing protein
MAERDRNERDRLRGTPRYGEGRASAFQGDYAGGRAGGGNPGERGFGGGQGGQRGQGSQGLQGRPGGQRDMGGVGRHSRGTREGGLGQGGGYGAGQVGGYGREHGQEHGRGDPASSWGDEPWTDHGHEDFGDPGHYGHAGGGSDYVGPSDIGRGRGEMGGRSEYGGYGGYGAAGMGYPSQPRDWSEHGQHRGGRGEMTGGGGTRPGIGDWGNQGYGVAPHLLIGSGREGEGGSERRNRGPKGWSRSDERIQEDVCERLMGESGVDPSDVSVHVTQGVVTLSGTVPNRQMKYRIEELADHCAGVKDVDNKVRVNRAEGLFGSSGSSSKESSRGGLLGRLFGFSTGTRVSDVMTRNPQVVSPDETVARVAQLMKTHDVGAIPVCDGTRLVGMVTDRDITIRIIAEAKKPDQAKARDAMTAKVHWCYEDDEVENVLEKMGDLQVRRIPVVDRDKHLVGIVALGDLSRHDAGDVQDALEEISERRSEENR